MDSLDPRATNRRGSYAKILSRRGSALTIDFRPNLNTSKDDISGSPKSPLAASTSTVSLMSANGDNSRTRIFKALTGIEFFGVPLPSDETIPPPNTAAPFSGVPVFLGPDGTLYDVNYVHVTEYTPATNGTANPKDKVAFVPGSPVYNNFPEAESFENFFDYEQAVMDWKDSVLKNLGWLQLPTVLGRFYSRPKLISESRARRDSTTSSDSTSFQDLLDDKGGVSTGSFVDSPPVDRISSMDAFEFVPSPLHDSVLDRVGSTSITIDSDQESELYSPSGGVAGLQRQLREMTEHDFSRAAQDVLIDQLNDSPNNSEREDVSKSPRTVFRKSQSFSRSGSGSSSPGGPHRKLTHRLSDPGDLRAEGYEETRWVYSRDPWESTLVPPEPVPAFYVTYEEYEAAMKRWAKECILKMSYIPPHPLQLQEVIQLCPALEHINDRAHSVQEAVGPNIMGQVLPVCKVKSGENTYDQLFEPLKKRQRAATPPRPPPPPRGPDSPGPTKLSAPAQRKLLECIDTLSRNIDPKHLVRRTYLMMGDIMPAFSPNWKQSIQGKVAAHTIPELPLKAARRTDIFSELDMSPLQKDFPDPEPVLNYSKLIYSKQQTPENQQNLAKAKQSIIELDQAFRHDHLYSAYATVNPKEQVLLKNLVKEGPVNLDTLKRILTSRMFVDKFEEVIKDTVPNSYDDSTYLSAFMDLLNAENLRSILDYFVDSTEDLIHGKVSALISSILGTPKGHTWVALVIESYVDHEDVQSLYHFALAANYLQAKPSDIYPYKPNLHAAVIKKVFKNAGVQVMVDQVYLYYYLGLISKSSTHPDIKEWLDSKKKEVSDQMANNLQKDKFVINDIFRGISHRSSTLSNFFLFIGTRLFHCYDVGIQKLLRSPDISLVGSVCNLACSKFIHTQYAARRLFALLLEDPWRDFFLTELDKGKTFLEDLTSVAHYSADVPSLLSTLLLTVVDSAMANIPKNKDQRKNYAGGFLLTDEMFHKALSIITKGKSMDASVETASVFLVTVSKALYTHNLAEASDKLKTTTKSKMEKAQEIVQISLADIQNISQLIHNKVNANDKYHIRTNMLNVLRNLLKHSRTFDLLKKETHIFLRLVGFCKDGKNLVFNKAAWKVFYQLIHYHKEAIEQFEKSKVLAQFLDILGTNSGNTIMLNSLHYIYKIFAILETEPERIKSGKMVSRGGDTKSVEKDLKTLSRTFVQSHLFIKIHMMYRRLAGHQQGASFIQLALLYHIIGKNPLCKKLCKDIQRNPEYKDGLFKICSMFEPPNSATPVPNLALV